MNNAAIINFVSPFRNFSFACYEPDQQIARPVVKKITTSKDLPRTEGSNFRIY